MTKKRAREVRLINYLSTFFMVNGRIHNVKYI